MPSRKVSKADWLRTALEFLGREGVDAVRVERLARKLGVAKSGFYWHFRDREQLLQEMLDYWSHEYTGVVAANPEVIALEPKRRLRVIAEMVIDHGLTDYDLAMRSWATIEPEIGPIVRRVDRDRLRTVGTLLAECGFAGDELETRKRILVTYLSSELTLFQRESRSERLARIRDRVSFFTRP